MLLPDYHKNPTSITFFDFSSAIDVDVALALATSLLAMKPALTILGYCRDFSSEGIAEDITADLHSFTSGPAAKSAASSLVVARNDTTNIVDGHFCPTRVMGAVGDDGKSNKEWTRAGNGGRLVRNESGSDSHGTDNGNVNSDGSGGGGSGASGADDGSRNGNSNGGGGSTGGSDRRAHGGRRSSSKGSSKRTSAKQASEFGGAPPPPPPPPSQIALAVDDGLPKGFPSHQNPFELFDWITTAVGLAVLFSLGKWACDRRNAQRVSKSVEVCPMISTSCPTIVQIPPNMCLRPDLASVYDPISYPTPACLPRQGLFYDWGCERVSDGAQFNISTEEAFEILNGAARPNFHQNRADIGCGDHARITTPALSSLDIIVIFLFSLVAYLMGYVHRFLGWPRSTPTDRQAGRTSHPALDAQDNIKEPDSLVSDIVSQQAASNTDSSGSGPSLNPSAAPFIPTQPVATPTKLPMFHFIPIVDTPERHGTRRAHKNVRRGH
ncbi:hypothetical protein M413DRAFT_391297 [Hebeloma cylindrosporum]|uniref:Uncharacterized protein n=1 Tax=Hebeloma cylindrosporum TaxID=76867 RepID=A0A0C3BDB8_HEBCY|nr:hypothetical protein M413DRAFT_391297 [Hebeloma cylindrosporum h7]